jgi:extradiol dioxygenase family protein
MSLDPITDPAVRPAFHLAIPVDGHAVPVPHFGLVLPVPDFHRVAERLRAAGTTFVIEPYVRFAGQVGEQWTMFFHDPAGNAIEFKAFADGRVRLTSATEDPPSPRLSAISHCRRTF